MWHIYVLAGAIGGLVPVLDWLSRNLYQVDKVKWQELFRNLALGALIGGIGGVTYNSVEVAVIAGTAGEIYVRNIGKLLWYIKTELFD